MLLDNQNLEISESRPRGSGRCPGQRQLRHSQQTDLVTLRGWQLWRGNQLLVPGASGRYGLCGPDLLGGHSRQGLSGSCLEPELFGAGLVLGRPNYTPGLDFRNDFTILILQHSLLMLRLQKCPSGIPEVDPDEHV
jgi:hypothetical protein